MAKKEKPPKDAGGEAPEGAEGVEGEAPAKTLREAVKDAMAEGQLTGDYVRRIAAARKPVFSMGTLAMALTMATAILGASVDTRVLPPMIHAAIAYAAIACNLAAAKIEIDALVESSRVVDEVNRRLES